MLVKFDHKTSTVPHSHCFSHIFLQVEYMLVKFDHEQKKATLTLKAEEVLEELQKEEKINPE